MNGEPVSYDPETDTLLVELRPWPAASPAEINDQVGGEDVEDGLVVHYGPDALPQPSRSSTPRGGQTSSRAPSPRCATPKARRVRIGKWTTCRPRAYAAGSRQAPTLGARPRRPCASSIRARDGHFRLKTGPDPRLGSVPPRDFPSPADPPHSRPPPPATAGAGTDSHGPMDPPKTSLPGERLPPG